MKKGIGNKYLLFVVLFSLTSCGTSENRTQENNDLQENSELERNPELQENSEVKKNSVPEAIDQALTLNNNKIDIVLHGIDSDGDGLTYMLGNEPNHGKLTGTAPNLTYTSSENYVGVDTFTFKVNDGIADSTFATIRIDVEEEERDSFPNQPWSHGNLKVSDDKRMLQHTDGTGFFWMADTVWFMHVRMDRDEIDDYLTNRAEKGFTVIMSNIMSQAWEPNPYGDTPFEIVWGTNNSEAFKIDKLNITEGNSVPSDDHKSNPNDTYDYWDHLEYAIDKAAEKGLYMALVVTWGEDVKTLIKEDETIYTKYATFLAKRFKDKPNIIWLNGGDVFELEATKRKEWDWIGETIKAEDPNHLLSFHGVSSSYALHSKSWLDFNIIESGHKVATLEQNQRLLDVYNKNPIKPVLDGEPRYEEMTSYDVVNPHRLTPLEVREIEYFQLFSGSFGATYGHNSIWQVSREEDLNREDKLPVEKLIHPLRTWKEALDTPAAVQMKHLGKLMKSRPILERIPDQSLIMSGLEKTKATRGDGYAFIYTTSVEPIEIKLEKVSGDKVNIWSYNPRTGEAKALKMAISNAGSYTFDSGDTDDWVIVIDDASKGYEAPGTKRLLN